MFKRIIRAVGGDPQQKALEEFKTVVEYINALETEFEDLSEAELGGFTRQFRIRLAQGETLDDILPEAFAAVRDASKKTLGMRHYDVQLIGGIAMHNGIVAEMRTGEGKTLAATLPVYLNALELNPAWVEAATQKWGADPAQWQFTPQDGIPVGRGVHLITVNDYLARRDARWMSPIYHLLGMRVGVLQMASRTEHGQKAFIVDLEKSSPHEDQDQLQMVPRRQAYAADITYGTNSEFGFDYLRDNMKMRLGERVQRGHYYAIIDEVDNVLIDEARTPLIISGPSHEDSDNYVRMARLAKQLKPEDYEINERDRNISLTEIGETHAEQILGQPLSDPERPEDITPEQARLQSYLQQALRAEYIYTRNKDYVVQGRKVIIVDHFTGRLMPGRRWSDGLHQAVEAKEGVSIESESVTYATVTIQNYFRMYEKLAGMTGTAVTEAEEFNTIYNLDALAITTHLDYEAARDDTIFVTLQDRDEYDYKYTYYAQKEDPLRAPIYWKRKDYPDVIYRSEEAKLRAIVQEILAYHILGRPILVGTTSVELSERVSARLQGVLVRRLAQTMLIRDAWFEKNAAVEDGRQIPELVPLNAPLDQLNTAALRKIVRDEGLDLSLTPGDDLNLKRLLQILALPETTQERLAETLQSGISHQVLNARKHTEESQIIAGAGAFGAVTIATNMAGRGVDIKLGGELAEEILTSVNRILKRNGYEAPYDMSVEARYEAIQKLDETDYGIYGGEVEHFLRNMEEKERVRALGGLHVIGSERHEARRIDNQLRGRAARQGDPGSSRFYLSLEDELMVRFGGQQMEGVMARLNIDEAYPITNQLVSRIVEQSQTRVEGANFDVRKHLLEYDDVLNTQREKIYGQRDRILTKTDLSEDVTDMLREEVTRRVPEALEDEGGPWRLLSWLEQIQPPITLQGGVIFPSYALRIILEDFARSILGGDYQLTIHDWQLSVSPDQANAFLIALARDAIQAEEDHILDAVDRLLTTVKFNMESQLEERLDTLDMFIEGLSLDEASDTRNPQQFSQELTVLLHVPLEITSDMARALKDDPYSVEDELQAMLFAAMQALTVTRVIGAVERILKMPLGLAAKDLQELEWDAMAAQIVSAVREIYADRIRVHIGDETNPGQMAKDVRANIAKLEVDTLTERDLLNLMMLMPQGRRQAFDKKTHRRIWEQTTRLTYFYLAAQKFGTRASEEIAEIVLTHLEEAQAAIRTEWGLSELTRLGDAPLVDLTPAVQSGLRQALGDEQFAAVKQQAIGSLDAALKDQMADELGRQALTIIYRELLLQVISNLWVEYLTQMEALRVAIGLEAYAQRDPLVQYKTRAFEMFQTLLGDMRMSLVTRMFTFRPRDVSNVQATVQKTAVSGSQAQTPQKADRPKSGKKRRRRRR